MVWIIFLALVAVGAVFGVMEWRHRRTMRQLQAFAEPRALEAREHAPALKQLVADYAMLGSTDYDIGHLLVSGFIKPRGGKPNYRFPVSEADSDVLDRVVYFRVTATRARSLGGAEAAALLSLFGQRAEGGEEYGALYFPVPANFPQAMIRPRGSKGLPALTARVDTHWAEFNHRVEIRTPDERFISDLFAPRLLEFWNERLAKLQVNFVPGAVLLISDRWDLADYDRFVGLAEQLEARIPPHLITEYS